jgi:hypothetical protein
MVIINRERDTRKEEHDNLMMMMTDKIDTDSPTEEP